MGARKMGVGWGSRDGARGYILQYGKAGNYIEQPHRFHSNGIVLKRIPFTLADS